MTQLSPLKRISSKPEAVSGAGETTTAHHLAQWKSSLLPAMVLCILWLAMVVLVNPVGDFPLNDDWVYARAVYAFAKTGHIQLLGWQSATLGVQILWGDLFCAIFGQSFTALRASTLVLGLVGVLATYLSLQEAGARRPLALVGAATVAVNPVYFNLSCTFMTDVPYFAVSTIAIFCFVAGLRRSSSSLLAAGTLASICATSIRQIGVVVPIAFAGAYLIRHGVKVRTVLLAGLPAAVTALCLFGYEQWLAAFGALPEVYAHIDACWLAFWQQHRDRLVLSKVLDLFIHLGAFLVPVMIVSAWQASARRWGWLVARTVASVAIIGWLCHKYHTQHWWGNILTQWGLGPTTLRDIWIEGMPHLPRLPAKLCTMVEYAGMAAASLLLWLALRQLQHIVGLAITHRTIFRHWREACSITALILYSLPFFLLEGLFDRYYLPLLVLCLLLVVPSVKTAFRPRSYACSLAVLALYAAFTVAGTHDYLSWNQGRWQLLHRLMSDKAVTPQAIDGGYEFNGLYLYTDTDLHKPTMNGWFDQGHQYVISFGPLDGYSQVDKEEYRRWLTGGKGYVYALKKIALANEGHPDSQPGP